VTAELRTLCFNLLSQYPDDPVVVPEAAVAAAAPATAAAVGEEKVGCEA
jgi:hypothetical protein